MNNKEPIAIKEALEKTIGELGLKKAIENSKAVDCWSEAVGEKIAQKSKAQKIIKGTLYVKAKNPIWSQQLSLMGERLKEKINDRLGTETVKQIRFRS